MNDSQLITYHTVGEGVTRLRHRQTLDHLGGHPGERTHQWHVCGVGQELGRTKITDLEGEKEQR